ncbi:MBL fold metallo-hydrolase [Muriicola marianensis]|uniref:Metallo-beta-lactamase domain-containing protein n=1 Tax=Muriicola marianensis TaxID=1324801 RepID=A0ABQ1QWS9_9FLAO|nr:MBL fold metallo-hydrolase [Muriicola marianensis]GGD50283.1 hypothetical protein GCM10011361_16130 [Muriicola marianensis]
MRSKPLKYIILSGVLIFLFACRPTTEKNAPETEISGNAKAGVRLMILGTAQDAGSPQVGCEKACCKDLFENPDPKRKVVSLGLIDGKHKKQYLFEATPDLPSQLHFLNRAADVQEGIMPDGVFLTHAHIGHYSGLMFFGKEAVNAKEVPVHAMPRMADFLQHNGPWGQLVSNQNIRIEPLLPDSAITLAPSVSVVPLRVPHRDEYSETVGFIISGPEKKALFIPDIDKWERWDRKITDLITEVDYAFLDATFFDGDELNTRDISEIPHPFVVESMELFETLPPTEKQKIIFIHFNHTNPLLSRESEAYRFVTSRGFRVASFGDEFDL